MTSQLEYHVLVRHTIPASVALFALLALSVIFVAGATAQINGAPSSVTSPGFGGRPVNAPKASVTSLGPNGYAPNTRVTFSAPFENRREGHHHNHHHYVEYSRPIIYAVPVPYAVGAIDENASDNADDNADDNDADYQGGPTIFDRRGAGATSYVPPVRDVPHPHSASYAQRADASPSTDFAPAPPDPPQPRTLLVFRDGRKLEVGNYAIVGESLIDLTPGHVRRVALSDLDLDATRKENDDRGVTFQIPPSQQAN